MSVGDDTEKVIPFAGPRGRRVGKLTLLSDIDAVNATPRDYYLKGLISPAEMSVIYGTPGCGKSFLILYIARAIAQEREIFGRRVHATNVLFLALEGVSGFENRLQAEIKRHDQSDGFFYIAQPVDLFLDLTAVKDTISAAELAGAGIIIIDTMNRALAGGSENDSSDMGTFIKNLDNIRVQTGAHICVIHHSGKDQSNGPRGHSSLLGAADLVLEVKRIEETVARTVKIIKAKDDPDRGEMSFSLDVADLGVDIDGDKITTCVVIEDDQPKVYAAKEKPYSKEERAWLSAIADLFNDGGKSKIVKPYVGKNVTKTCVTRADLREWARSRGLFGVTENVTENAALTPAQRKSYERIITSLQERKKITVQDNWIWLNSE